MRKFLAFAMLLTTLFVGAMPLPAAYADTGDKVETQACSTMLLADFTAPEVQAQLKEQGGAFTVLTAESDMVRFVKRWNKVSPIPFPYEVPEDVNTIVISTPGKDADHGAVTVFKDGCFVGQGRVPADGIPFLLTDGDPA